jgi:hypothetical protein
MIPESPPVTQKTGGLFLKALHSEWMTKRFFRAIMMAATGYFPYPNANLLFSALSGSRSPA